MKFNRMIVALVMAVGLLCSSTNSAFAKGYSGGGGSHASSGSSGGSHSSGGGSHYYSSPSSSSSSSHSYTSAAPSTPSSSGSSSRYGGGSGSTTSGRTVPHSSFDSGARDDAHADSSSHNYAAAHPSPPKVTYSPSAKPQAQYVPPGGTAKPIKESDPEVAYLRGRLSGERYANRQQTRNNFYSNYHYNYPPSYGRYYSFGYSDPYSNDFIWHWLMFQSLQTQTDWVYNHQAQIDQQRLNDMYGQNAQLRAQVAQMQANHVAVNPSYQPPGVEPEVVYNDGYVGAVVNPVQNVSYDEPVSYNEESTGPPINFGHAIWVLIKFFFYLALFIALVYVVISAVEYSNQR